MDAIPPNPWKAMERWRRATLIALAAVMALAYVARHAAPSTDGASRVVVVAAGLAALFFWSRRPRPTAGGG